MKRFLLTSPKLAGQIDVLYGIEGELLVLDLTQAKCNSKQVRYLMTELPLNMEGLESFCSKTQITAIEAGVEITFKMFWDKYSLKRNRDGALKVWEKMSDADRVLAYFSLDSYSRYLKRTPWLNKMYPDTYLRGKHYKDEFDSIK